jgi:hypothetical protein
MRRNQEVGAVGVRIRDLSRVGGLAAADAFAERGVRWICRVGTRRVRVQQHRGTRMVEDEVVKDEKAGHRRQQGIGECVAAAVAELVDGEIVGAGAVPRSQLGGGKDAAGRGQRAGRDRILPVEHVDLVARRKESQDLGRVIGDPGGLGRQRRAEGEPRH